MAPRSTAEIKIPAVLTPVHNGSAARREVLSAETDDARRAIWFADEDVIGGLPAARFDAVVLPVFGGYQVKVTARGLLVDLTLFPDRLDPAASVDKGLITLFSGETTVFEGRSRQPLELALLVSSPVPRCANDLFGSPVAGR